MSLSSGCDKESSNTSLKASINNLVVWAPALGLSSIKGMWVCKKEMEIRLAIDSSWIWPS